MFAPIVDTRYSKWLGKRRSWIIPAQLLAGITMYVVGEFLQELLALDSVILVTFIFGIVFTCLAIQDIAVDGWAVTIVKEENLSYSSSSQTVGLALGVFLSTTGYLAFNSLNF